MFISGIQASTQFLLERRDIQTWARIQHDATGTVQIRKFKRKFTFASSHIQHFRSWLEEKVRKLLAKEPPKSESSAGFNRFFFILNIWEQARSIVVKETFHAKAATPEFYQMFAERSGRLGR
jgi:hypothetical protein